MKKLILSLFMAVTASVAMAQPAAGTFSIIPRVGVSIANLPNDQIYTADGLLSGVGKAMSPHNKAGFMGGLDVDYQFTDNLSVSLGALYVQQGCRYDNNSDVEKDAAGNTVKGSGFSNISTQLHYIQVPLMLNCYIAQDFAVKVGVQLGFPVSGKTKYDEAKYVKDDDGNMVPGKPERTEVNLNSTLSKVTFSVPVGLSYEFANVILDARYNIGFTKYQNVKDMDSKNKVFMFSAAYRFRL